MLIAVIEPLLAIRLVPHPFPASLFIEACLDRGTGGVRHTHTPFPKVNYLV